MEAKIQELVDKIYDDGVGKAKIDAEKLIEQAYEEAERICGQAKQEAKAIIDKALQEAESKRISVEAELTLGADQTLSNLRRRIESIVARRVIESPLQKLALDVTFLRDMILMITSAWTKEDANFEIDLLLPEKIRENTEEAVMNSILKELDGLSISFDEAFQGGFHIARKGDSFFLDFSDAALLEYFLPFVSKKTAALFVPLAKN